MHTFLILVINFSGKVVEIPLRMFDTNAECTAAGIFITDNVQLAIKGATELGLMCVMGA